MNDMFGAPRTLRRFIWSLIFVLLLVLVYRCSAQNAAQLSRYAHHGHATVAMAVAR